jgi:hypothetical protein
MGRPIELFVNQFRVAMKKPFKMIAYDVTMEPKMVPASSGGDAKPRPAPPPQARKPGTGEKRLPKKLMK